MSAKDEVRALIDGLTEEQAQKLLDGIVVYGPAEFDLGMHEFVDAAKRQLEPAPPPPAGVLVVDPDIAEFLEKMERRDTPLLRAFRTGERAVSWGKNAR
jgi:hypothetical protein